MTSAVDFSNARLDPAALKAAGVTHVIRYLADPSWPKALSRSEAESYLAQGIRVVLNFEQQANQATFGYARGLRDAALANGLADGIGAPPDLEIFYSSDTGAGYDQIAPYYQGAAAYGKRPVSIYGPLNAGLRLKAEGTVKSVWVTNAASWSGFYSWDQLAAAARAANVALLQHLDHPLVGLDPNAYDFNEVLSPPKAWGDPYVPAPQPKRKKSEMLVVNCAGKPAALVSGDTVRHIGEATTLKQLADQGVPAVTVDAAEYKLLTAGTAVS